MNSPPNKGFCPQSIKFLANSIHLKNCFTLIPPLLLLIWRPIHCPDLSYRKRQTDTLNFLPKHATLQKNPLKDSHVVKEKKMLPCSENQALCKISIYPLERLFTTVCQMSVFYNLLAYCNNQSTIMLPISERLNLHASL